MTCQWSISYDYWAHSSRKIQEIRGLRVADPYLPPSLPLPPCCAEKKDKKKKDKEEEEDDDDFEGDDGLTPQQVIKGSHCKLRGSGMQLVWK